MSGDEEAHTRLILDEVRALRRGIEAVVEMSEQWGARLSRDALPDALLSSSRRGDEAHHPGIYAPVFPRGTPKTQINDELRRHHRRYPLRITGPPSHDPAARLLSLDGA